jgi:hypothetical protein
MKQITAQYLSEREEENEDKVKQNGPQNENLTLLHCTVEATVLPLVGSGRMEERDSHLSAIYIRHTVTFTAVPSNE